MKRYLLTLGLGLLLGAVLLLGVLVARAFGSGPRQAPAEPAAPSVLVCGRSCSPSRWLCTECCGVILGAPIAIFH